MTEIFNIHQIIKAIANNRISARLNYNKTISIKFQVQ